MNLLAGWPEFIEASQAEAETSFEEFSTDSAHPNKEHYEPTRAHYTEAYSGGANGLYRLARQGLFPGSDKPPTISPPSSSGSNSILFR